jgi:hypothetical protein
VAYPELVNWLVTFWGPKGLFVGRCDPELDPEASQGLKMLKNESARNATKPVPLRPSRLLDSGGIFTSSNGLRMSKISRSVRKGKQAKKGDDCTYRIVRTVPRGMLTVQVVRSIQMMWHLQEVTHGRLIWLIGRELDQSRGDTCHHCKGDTWHGMTSAGTVADTW